VSVGWVRAGQTMSLRAMSSGKQHGTTILTCTFWLMFLNTGVIHSRVTMSISPVVRLASGVWALRGRREQSKQHVSGPVQRNGELTETC
jgi:hypothetical protein